MKIVTDFTSRAARGPAAPAAGRSTGPRQSGDYRRLIHESGVIRVLDISATHSAPPSGFSHTYQIVLPYAGIFTYSIGQRSALIDTNQTLMVPANVEFTDGHPVRDVGHSLVAVTPAPDVMDELCRRLGSNPARVFDALSRSAGGSLRLATHRLRMLTACGATPLEADEAAIDVLRAAIGAPAAPKDPAPRVVERAKEVIHGRGFERISLEDVARSVGVSPVYLTQQFSQAEGLPLYKYQMRLRLNRALVELPDCADITGLALDLGFSSHSHFSAAFRQAFAITPAEFRASARAPGLRSPSPGAAPPISAKSRRW